MIFGAASFQHSNVTEEGRCSDARPDPGTPGKWRQGVCFFPFLRGADNQELLDSDSFTVNLELSLVYASSSRVLGAGVECDALRLETLNTSGEPLLEKPSTPSAAVDLGVEINRAAYAEVRY